MGLLDGIEKLITEHGSAVVLRERIALAREQYAVLEKKVSALQTENDSLKFSNGKLEERVRDLEQQLSQIHSGNSSGYVCDHCGSPRLKRIGNRPDPTFGEVGIKQAVFSCIECGKESAFTQDP
jgi:DNA-directed RNA polymerase subunit RPC12/RpoP